MLSLAFAKTLRDVSVPENPDIFEPDPPLDLAGCRQIDATVEEWIAANGVPSASVAIVRGGKLAYAKAYGAARLSPRVSATAATRYPIYSIAKQFTAAAVLALVEDGKLDLDGAAGSYLADLGAASGVTLRQLLTHTGGVADYWTQDYVAPFMQRPASRQDIIRGWAHRPLEFAPGSHWQYSNTGYVILGAIVERVAGRSLYAVLEECVFTPLGMKRVSEHDSAPLGGEDAAGYTRAFDGPVRPAPKEAPGWLFAACDLAMTPSDLAKWNEALLARSILAPDLLAQALSPAVLPNGRVTGYGFGVLVDKAAGRRRIGHDGIGSGFLTDNRIWPDDRAAITVFTNGDWADAGFLRERLTLLVLPLSERGRRVRDLFAAFQAGRIDRALLSGNFNAFLTDEMIAEIKAGLAPLGPARRIVLDAEDRRGGMMSYYWTIVCRDRRLKCIERVLPDGKIEEFTVRPALD